MHQNLLRLYGSKIGDNVQTYGSFFRGIPSGLQIGDGVRIMAGGMLMVANQDASLVIGKNCYINRNATIDCHIGIKIGERVGIGPNTYIGDFDHGRAQGTGRAMYGSKAEILIEDDTWIGANSVILKGVRIGAGATVGAGSIVTKNVGAGEVVAGNPARLIGGI